MAPCADQIAEVCEHVRWQISSFLETSIKFITLVHRLADKLFASARLRPERSHTWPSSLTFKGRPLAKLIAKVYAHQELLENLMPVHVLCT